MLNMDILTYLRLIYRDASLLTTRLIFQLSLFQSTIKWTYILSSNDLRVTTMYNLYLTVAGIIMHSFKSKREGHHA